MNSSTIIKNGLSKSKKSADFTPDASVCVPLQAGIPLHVSIRKSLKGLNCNKIPAPEGPSGPYTSTDEVLTRALFNMLKEQLAEPWKSSLIMKDYLMTRRKANIALKKHPHCFILRRHSETDTIILSYSTKRSRRHIYYIWDEKNATFKDENEVLLTGKLNTLSAKGYALINTVPFDESADAIRELDSFAKIFSTVVLEEYRSVMSKSISGLELLEEEQDVTAKALAACGLELNSEHAARVARRHRQLLLPPGCDEGEDMSLSEILTVRRSPRK